MKEKSSKGYTPGQDGTPYTSPDADKQPSGLMPQLLNPIEEEQVLDLISDDNYCAQKKHNGKHLLVRKEGEDITGINKKGSCHLLRHSVATLMLEGGPDIRYVAEMLGHARLETTQRYTRVDVARMRAVYDKAHPRA